MNIITYVFFKAFIYVSNFTCEWTLSDVLGRKYLQKYETHLASELKLKESKVCIAGYIWS